MKSPNQIIRNNARAAAHRAAKNNATKPPKPAEKVSLDSYDVTKPAVENPSSANPTAAVGDKINDENDDPVIQDHALQDLITHAEAVSPAAANGFQPTPFPPPPAVPALTDAITDH